MPELPEVEITARLLDRALRGAQIESALAPGINALKTFDPPLSELSGERILAVRRRGKHLIVEISGELALLIHLMSAGRLQLFGKRAGPRDRTSRLLVRVREGDGGDPAAGSRNGAHEQRGSGEMELRLREFGSRQAAWVKLLAHEAAGAGRVACKARAGSLARPAGARRAARFPASAAHAPSRPAHDRRDRALVGR